MSWSYNPSQLSVNAKDVVRLLIGDVVNTDQQMQDEEIAYLATVRGSVYGTAAECCRALAAKFSRSVDQQAGKSKVYFSQMARAYSVKAIEFDVKASYSAMPFYGSFSVSDKMAEELNNDRVKPQFTIGMMDNFSPERSGGNETLESPVSE